MPYTAVKPKIRPVYGHIGHNLAVFDNRIGVIVISPEAILIPVLEVQVESLSRQFIKAVPQGRIVPITLYHIYHLCAWLEGLVNAVTHRDYSISGDYIRVTMFDDRIEFLSPGKLPGIVTVENIQNTRFSRNPLIA